MSTSFLDSLRDVGVGERLSFAPLRWIEYLELVLQVRRERRALGRLSAEQIADLGLDRADVAAEVARGVFDVPRSRL